jgi:peptidoglycan/LPS O-acetylase OafA/YrhL
MRRHLSSNQPAVAIPAAPGAQAPAVPLAHTHGESERFEFLDSLRGIAVLSVFLAHAAGALWPAYEANVTPYFYPGDWGVVLFLFCSGFIIPVSLERQGSLGSFWVRRVFRLYPLYWLNIAFIAALRQGEAGVVLAADPAQSAKIILANLTMFQGFVGIPHLMALYWTLTLEMLFYLIVSVLFLLKCSARTVYPTLGLLAAMIVVELCVDRPFATSYMTHLLIILAGLVAYRVHSGAASARVGVAIAVLLPLMLAAPLLADPHDRHEQLGWATAQLGASAVFALAFLRRARPVRAPLRYLGRISYSIYLMHPVVMGLVPRLPRPELTLLAWLAGTILVASATYRWVELPAIAVGQRLTRAIAGASGQETR